MSKILKGIVLIVVVFFMMNSFLVLSFAEEIVVEESFVESIALNEESVEDEIIELETVSFDVVSREEIIEEDIEIEEIETAVSIVNDFIEETSSGQHINDYEEEVLEIINEIIESSELIETETTNTFENSLLDKIYNNIEEKEIVDEEIETLETEDVVIATINEIDDIVLENNLFETTLFGAGIHEAVASPSVVIHSTYDRYEIYTGENEGTVTISDDNGIYYNSNTNVKVIRDLSDSDNNNPILLSLANNVKVFGFDNSNDNYVLLPDGFVESIISKYSGNGYLNPQGINRLDHIEVNVEFNNTNLGKYDLFEYGVLYYLSCYEGVLGEYYYYDPNTTDIDKAALFYVNNRIMDRTYNVVSEYYYKSPSGEQLTFKPTWVINSNNLTGSNKETYAKQWVNFPYFLIKTGEKYWNLRDSIEQSTYLSEYSEGYYEQYLTERPYGNVSEKLVVLDDVFKTEESLLYDNTRVQTVHPYVKSDNITITGNFRKDNINDVDKLPAGGVLPYDTNAVLNISTTERKAKTIQVYLNGEKLITNNNRGLYTLTNGKCQVRIDGSKLLDEENSRNVVSFIVLDEIGEYVTDAKGRIVNSYISLIRSSNINKATYTISFNTNGGTTLPNIYVEEGNKLSLPTNPRKEGFVFQGWYNDQYFQNRFDTNEYITGGKTLYALWGQSISYSSSRSRSSGGGGGGGSGSGVSVSNKPVVASMLNPLETLANTNTSTETNTNTDTNADTSTNTDENAEANTATDKPNTMNTIGIKGNWFKTDDKWSFTDSDGKDYKNTWVLIDVSNNPMDQRSDWYRFDEDGNMLTGYYTTEDGRVYCFNDGALNEGDEGKMLVGWHWLPSSDDEYCCYYFETNIENRGVLVTDTVTSDGYTVDEFGRWLNEDKVQRRSYR